MIPNPTLSVLGRKIAFSTFVQYAGKIVQLVLAMLTLKLISNFLSENDYGVYAKITEYALFFSTIANLGIFGNLVRVMADLPRDGSIFLNALILRILTAALFFAVAVLYLFLSGGDQVFLRGSLLFFGALLFDFVTNVCDGMLQANYLMGRATLALIAGRAVNFLVTLLIVKSFTDAGASGAASVGPSMFFLFAATLAGSLVTAALSLYFVRKKIDWSWKVSRALMLKIFEAGILFGIINIFNNLYFRFLPDFFAQNALTEAQFGSFNVSFRIAQVLSLFSTFLMFSVLPGFKEYVDQKHWHKALQLYKKIEKILAASGILLVVGGSLFGSFAIELLTHKKYILPEFWFVLPLMLLLAAISYGYDLILITLFAVEKDFWLLKRESLALLVALLLFGLSMLMPTVQIKLLLIIGAAISGETLMVVLGSLKIRKVFKAASAHASPEAA